MASVKARDTEVRCSNLKNDEELSCVQLLLQTMNDADKKQSPKHHERNILGAYETEMIIPQPPLVPLN